MPQGQLSESVEKRKADHSVQKFDWWWKRKNRRD